MSSGPKKYNKNVYKRSPFGYFMQRKTDKYLHKGLTFFYSGTSGQLIPGDPAVFTP